MKKGRVNDTQLNFEFEAGNDKEYKIDGIQNSAVYAKESSRQLPGLYYLVLWTGYREEENTWEPALAIQHLRRLVTTYHKDNSKKPTATSVPVNIAPPMTRPTAAPTKKRGRPTKFTTTTTKRAKKS